LKLAATAVVKKLLVIAAEGICHEPLVAESRRNERKKTQKMWITEKFSAASSACSFHGTARN
jgi:hypothetical protein